MKMLEQAKKALGDAKKTYLLVGVNSDEQTHKYKGKTVMNHEVRCESVRHCKWVDEVVAEAPWVLTNEFLDKYKIDFVAHDALPYTDTSGAAADGDVYSGVKKRGMFLETKRTEGISTSDLIVAIIKDYDAYIDRNLKRGYTKAQMNVGKTWEARSEWHKKEKTLKEKAAKIKQEYKDLSDSAKAFIKSFQPQGDRGRQYVQRLRHQIPHQGEGIVHHCWGLTLASLAWCGYLASFCNPLSYCKKKYK
jgi:choline-phosphate cytidylyltransferase